ncbi:MAG: FAD-dependent oxidoreductase [Deltaproteobacteria bacterium]|nr:FAD-dependent oxidoreductase [Deltaproteobacteria bacterium]
MTSHRKKVVVLGTGFAGFSFVKNIDTNFYKVIVVSPRNHFLFTPLLPSTTVGTIEFRSIIEPIRSARTEIEYYQAACAGIDETQNIIHCEAPDGKKFDLTYDQLVISVGAVSNTYDVPGVTRYALFLRELSDARAIRQKIIECLEQAGMPNLPTHEQERLLHFVVVGGGPTGVELAAELHDFLEEDLSLWFPNLSQEVTITVLEATEKILGSFDARLGQYALRTFQRQRIEVRTGRLVKEVREKEIVLQDGSTIPYGLCVWSTGIGPAPLIERLSFPKSVSRRLLVDSFLCLKGCSNIYAMGDCATVEKLEFPPTAQVAQQEGKYLAKMFNRMAKGKTVKSFRYHHFGMLAYIGGKKALADLPEVKGRGFATYLFWRSAYLTRLVSLKNKILVLFDWFKTRAFGRDISRF